MRIWRDGPQVPATASISRSVTRFRRVARLLVALCLAGALIGDLAANRRRPYLPAVGPIPVRFEVAQLPTLAKFTLPPLDMGVPSQGAVEIATTPPPVPAVAEPAAPPASPSADPSAPENQVVGPLQPLPGPAPTVAPPEPPAEPALIQASTAESEAAMRSRVINILRTDLAGNAVTGVFSRTNSSWIGVVPSVGFQPPAPANSSSATYSVSRPPSP